MTIVTNAHYHCVPRRGPACQESRNRCRRAGGTVRDSQDSLP